MTKEEVTALLWRIYLAACVCDMDYASKCNCDAGFIAARELCKLLGDDWHNKMREAVQL